MSKNPSHKNHISRINRAIGQLEAIKRMIEEEEYCINIMSQVRAVKTIELGILETHISNCLADACASNNEAAKEKRLNEIIQLLKKYE
jgi:CsoR family transcriptional regulator, copper-sensing transcriptional repressor